MDIDEDLIEQVNKNPYGVKFHLGEYTDMITEISTSDRKVSFFLRHECIEFMSLPLSDMPLYINDRDNDVLPHGVLSYRAIFAWYRMKIGK